MDRAHRLGQTKQVTVYRMITRGTIEERIRKRALQKEEVQKVVISGGASGGVDFNTRNRDNRTKDIAMWLADDDQAALIEQKEKEAADKPPEDEAKTKKSKKAGAGILKRKRGEMSLDDMYHEGKSLPTMCSVELLTPLVQGKDTLKMPVRSHRVRQHRFRWLSLQHQGRLNVPEEGKGYRRRRRQLRRGCESLMPKETWAWVRV